MGLDFICKAAKPFRKGLDQSRSISARPTSLAASRIANRAPTS